jgi:hypothetical protein
VSPYDFEGAARVTGPRDHLKVGLNVHELGEGATEQGVVIHQGDADDVGHVES